MVDVINTFEKILKRFQNNYPYDLLEVAGSFSSTIEKLKEKETYLKNSEIIRDLSNLISENDVKMTMERQDCGKKSIEQPKSSVEKEAFNNDFPVGGLFPIRGDEFAEIPLSIRNKLTVEKLNSFVKIMDEMIAMRRHMEINYFKLPKHEKDMVIAWRECNNKILGDRPWLFQKDITKKIPEKDKLTFVKYGISALKNCNRIKESKAKGEAVLVFICFD
uniref:SCP domain-containing protein n=1 Tax=Parastrongyloides trichosuri TaxID=131310 RepID=A0A0N4ZA19_PARTI